MSHDRGIRRLLRRARRGLRGRVGAVLARRTGTPAPVRAALPTPDRILICRVNNRLGNTLFLTPLIRSLAATYPRARIDVLIGNAANTGLLRTLPSVNRVHTVPKGLWRMPAVVRTLREQRYDLAVDPNTQSMGNRTAQLLSGARYRLGFAGCDQWVRLTHAAAAPTEERHEARRPLNLLSEAIDGITPKIHRELSVFPDSGARRRAGDRLSALLGQQAETRPVIGFFAEATGRKSLPLDWWQRWRMAMTAAGDQPVSLIQLVRPGEFQTLDTTIPPLSVVDPVELAAVLARMDAFVAADSGPMHLAAAAGVPVVGLFRATDPAGYAPLGHGCISLSEPLDPDDVARRTRAIIAEQARGHSAA